MKKLEDAEVYLSWSKSKSVEVEDGKISSVTSGESMALAVRVVRNKRIGFAYATTTLENLERNVEELYKRAESLAKVSPEVPWWEGFPSSECKKIRGLFSEEIASKDLEFMLSLMKDTLRLIPKDVYFSSSFEISENLWFIANTEGTGYEERSTNVDLGIALARKEGGYMTKTLWDETSSHSKIPVPEELIEGMMDDVKKLKVKPRRVRGEKIVYFDPRAASQLLDFIAEMFSAEAIAKGESPLSGKLDEKVFSKHISMTDNPALPGGPASHGCDEEGVRTSPLTLVEEGTVKGLLTDLYWGYKLGTKGGRGFRPTPYSPPSPDYTNLTLHTGNAKEEGVRVLGLTGLHTASPETGYMSVILSPAFEDGEHVEATLSINVLELLGERVEGLGSRGRWVSSIFTPGILTRVTLS